MADCKSLLERFEEKYCPEPNTGCWLWTAAVDTGGYGLIGVRGASRGAHRVSWMLHKGEIPAGMHVLHMCDQPLCVNPEHLFLGSHADNMRDMKEKGRATGPKEAKGSKNGYAQLTESDVKKIKEDLRAGKMHREIAAEYNVVRATISMINTGKSWAHVD